MRHTLPLLLALGWSAPALAYDTFVYYDPTLLTEGRVEPLRSALEAVGADVNVSADASWTTDWDSTYRLIILLLPAADFSPAQAAALETFVNGGGRLVVAGDRGGADYYGAWNTRINTLLLNMHVGMWINDDPIAYPPSGYCGYNLYTVIPDDLTDRLTYFEAAFGSGLTGGKPLLTMDSRTLVAVDQPSTAVAERTPYDVVLVGDVNIFLNTCRTAWTPGGNLTFWQNLYRSACRDADGDSFLADDCGGPDCDDYDADVFPGSPEVCNAKDDDCDGSADEDAVDAATWYADADADTYGNADSSREACTAPSGYVGDRSDCDDTRRPVHPGAPEVCNDRDDDCDASIDELAIDTLEWYADADTDGFGNPLVRVDACDAPAAHVADATDCNDYSGSVYPGATEIPYDGIDQNCDFVDLRDIDGDGFVGDGAGGVDCWDRSSETYPGAVEVADGIDQDCDGKVDEGTLVYDDDGDGVTELGGDCDDTLASVSAGAVEVANAVDDDCDGTVDEGTLVYDDDGDGFSEAAGDCNDGDPRARPGVDEVPSNGIDDDCDGVTDTPAEDDGDGDGALARAGDCDDDDPSRRPGAPEAANGRDDDCDAIVDEGTVAFDDDADTFTENAGDCDDTDPLIRPSAIEVANGRDDDCDGWVDEGTETSDDDGDGFSEVGGDCDDEDETVRPGADEQDDGLDNDCDGVADDGIDDLDGDGLTTADGDCDDRNAWRNPARAEQCDGLDNDCDGAVDELACADLDTDAEAPAACGCDAGAGSPLAFPALAALAVLRRRRSAR